MARSDNPQLAALALFYLLFSVPFAEGQPLSNTSAETRPAFLFLNKQKSITSIRVNHLLYLGNFDNFQFISKVLIGINPN